MAHDHFYGICENKCLVEIEHDNIPGVVPVEKGGTGAVTASEALSNLGAAAASHNHSAANITSGTLAIARGGTGATTASKAVSNFKTALVDLIYPVGSIHLSVNSANPSTYFGGTWVSWGAGRVPVGVKTSDSSFSTVEKTGGEKTHTLTIDEMPAHAHSVYVMGVSNLMVDIHDADSNACNWAGDNKTTTSAGGSQPHNNLQPYITCYMWKRTA